MEAFQRNHLKYNPTDKVGLAFCAGANQSIRQFLHASLMTDTYVWATVDDTADNRPTVLGNARNHRLLGSLPQAYFDVVLFANCPYTVYGTRKFDRDWLRRIKRLVKPGGEIIFNGLLGLEGWWRYDDFDRTYDGYFQKQSKDIQAHLRGEETPYLDELLEWYHANVDPRTRIEIRPRRLPFERPYATYPVFLVIPV